MSYLTIVEGKYSIMSILLEDNEARPRGDIYVTKTRPLGSDDNWGVLSRTVSFTACRTGAPAKTHNNVRKLRTINTRQPLAHGSQINSHRRRLHNYGSKDAINDLAWFPLLCLGILFLNSVRIGGWSRFLRGSENEMMTGWLREEWAPHGWTVWYRAPHRSHSIFLHRLFSTSNTNYKYCLIKHTHLPLGHLAIHSFYP